MLSPFSFFFNSQPIRVSRTELMLNDFRILNENTFSFKGGKLYLMLLRENAKFGVEVVDREKTFGRKFAKDREEAVFLFETIGKRLSRCTNLKSAEDSIKKAFSRKKLSEILFLFTAEGRTLTQDEIGELVIKYGLKVRTKYDYALDKRKKGAITIYVFFETKGKSIGKFYGKRFGSDFIFVSDKKGK